MKTMKIYIQWKKAEGRQTDRSLQNCPQISRIELGLFCAHFIADSLLRDWIVLGMHYTITNANDFYKKGIWILQNTKRFVQKQ